MIVPPPRVLALFAVRRALGITVFLYLFYVATHYVWGQTFPTAVDLLVIMAVVFAGVALGVAFSRVAPMPAETGIPRLIRNALLTMPALGIGIALQVFITGAQAERAYYAIFALAAWLGSGFIREEEDEGTSEDGDGKRMPSLFDVLDRRETPDDVERHDS